MANKKDLTAAIAQVRRDTEFSRQIDYDEMSKKDRHRVKMGGSKESCHQENSLQKIRKAQKTKHLETTILLPKLQTLSGLSV
jgi:hypothetical protein